MAKGIRFFTLLLAIALSGCSKPPEPPQLLQSFSSEIAFTAQELTGTASLVKTAENALTLKLQTPETLRGYQLCIQDGEITLSFGDVSSVLTGGLPDGALITVLADVLSAQGEAVQSVFRDPDWEFTGTLPKAAGAYLLTVSDAGVPQELLAEHAEISVTFLQTEPMEAPA